MNFEVKSLMRIANKKEGICAFKFSIKESLTKNILQCSIKAQIYYAPIITRGLQEWACLLPQELPFASVERLLGWQTQQPKVISASEVREIVKRHGERIRAAEVDEVEWLENE